LPSLASRIVKSFDRAQFDQHLQDLETELENFKLRYQDCLTDWEQYQTLQAQLQAPDTASGSNSPSDSPPTSDRAAMDTALESTLEQAHSELLQEYDRLQEGLQRIETRWEAQFFSWEGFGTVFWQVVRFLGLGLVLGWWLRGCAG